MNKCYAVYDTGLFISGELIEDIALKYNDALSVEEETLEPDELAEKIGLTRFGDVEGEFSPFDKTLNSTDLECEVFYMLSLERAKSLFTQAYKDFEEVEKEVTAKIQKYVPADFDYKSKLGEIVGTSFG